MIHRAIHLLLLAATLGSAAGVNRAEPIPLKTLVADLGNESYPVRVTATFELWSKGTEVLPLLESVVSSGEPEEAARARDLIRKIRVGLTPESNLTHIALIEKYDTADPKERRKIVADLKSDGAFLLLLKLYESEADPATLREIAQEMTGVAIRAAYVLLAAADPDYSRVREVLEMGRAEPGQLMALADFHRVQGTLKQELERARKNRKESGHLWRSYLLAADNRPLEAAREAESGGFSDEAARWRLLAGDPVPWVQRAEIPPHQIVPESLDAYRDAVRGLWEDRPVPRGFVTELSEGISDGMDDESWHSIAVLYALGARAEGDAACQRISPIKAFRFLETSERVDEALRLIEIDPESPDFANWLEPRLVTLVNDPENAEQSIEELKAVGGFMERRGLSGEAAKICVPHLLELSEKDPDWFCDLIGDLFESDDRDRQNRLSEAVLKAGVAFAGDDPGRIAMVRASLLTEDALSVVLWDYLARTHPDIGLEDHLRLAATLLGKLPDSAGLAEAWWKKNLAAAPDAAVPDDSLRWMLMLRLAIAQEDIGRYLEVEKLIETLDVKIDDDDELMEGFQRTGRRLQYQIYVGDAKQALEEYQKAYGSTPNSVDQLVTQAVMNRKIGNEKEARRLEGRMERLVLGQSHIMTIVAAVYASEGDFVRSGEWLKRSAMMSTNSDEVFIKACYLLSEDAKYDGDWRLSAALDEVSLFSFVMMGEIAFETPSLLLRMRNMVEVARALALAKEGKKKQALAQLEPLTEDAFDDPSMADFFFEAFRENGLHEIHDQWFEAGWRRYTSVIDRYPDSSNTLNTGAWVASRANRRLDDAQRFVERALELEPMQSAYLDTRAEVSFAKRDREAAVKFSDLAKLHTFDVSELLRQNQRFRSEPFPIK